MHNRDWLKLLLAGLAFAAFFAVPGLPLPGVDRLGLPGTAAAQETIDIDTFYDELAPYGQWVWHPRFGYVWLPEDVSPRWRPYTIGRWTYTDEYGWYWDSYEPFAWAVYHYGRWGYDQDYGWFWVPGDTWAPAWVQWRYSDDYVGWAPVGPGRAGYAYGVPVNYEPPVAESWVFVQPRYMTSRAIVHYAVPIGGLNVAFFAATNVYRPQYRGGIVYNYGMPRDRVAKIINRPIYVQKVYKVDNWKGGRFDNNGPNRGIKVYAPRFSKDDRPNHGPKKFADNPKDFRPKAKLNDTYKGDVPKGWGPSAKGVTPIAKEDPDAFKRKHDFGGRGEEFGDRGGKEKDRDQNRDWGDNKGEAKGNEPPVDKVIREQEQSDRNNDKGKPKGFGEGNQGGPNQFKQGNRDQKQGGDSQGKQKNFGATSGPEGPNQFQQGNRDQNNQGKQKNFGATGGPEGPNQFKQGNRDQDQSGDRKNKQKGFGEGSPGGPDQLKESNRNQNDQGGGGQGKQKGFNQFKQGTRDQDDQGGGGQGRQKGFGGGGPGSFGGPNNAKSFGAGGQGGPGGPGGPGGGGGQGGQRAQGNQGGGDGGGDKKDKCQKHPEKCQNQN
jgi:uncharacterized protein DUF6600